MEKLKLGLDVGGVLSEYFTVQMGADTSLLGPDYLKSPAVYGAIDGVKQLIDVYDLYIISKCGKKVELRTREWLKNVGIEQYISESKWYYCKKRHEKAPIAKELGLFCFVDDRLEVLSHMDVQYKFLFQPRKEENEKFKHLLDTVVVVNDWVTLTDKLLRISR
jgi:hypothetical protein